jgi:hypothetical protein
VSEKSYIRQIREAVVAALKADVALAAYMAAKKGHFYAFADGEKFPLVLTKTDCPAIVVDPAKLGRRPAGNVQDQIAIDIRLGCSVDSRDVGDVEDLFAMIESAIIAKAPSFGLTASWAPMLANWGGCNFEMLADKDKDGEFLGVYWGASDTLSLVLRKLIV